jgi:hypothetical protein
LAEDWIRFPLDLLGYDEYMPGSSIIHRVLPEPDPRFDGMYCDGCRLVSIDGRPVDDPALKCLRYVDDGAVTDPSDPDNSGRTDGMARFTVSFRAPLYTLRDDTDAQAQAIPEFSRYVVKTTEDAVETLNIGTAGLRFADDRRQVPATSGILFPTAVYTYNWLRVPVEAEPKVTIAATNGKVNKDEFDGKSAETMLVMPPKRRLYQAANTYTYLDFSFSMIYRRTGWNNFYDPSSGNYRRVERTATPGVGAYETADVTKLFDPASG